VEQKVKSISIPQQTLRTSTKSCFGMTTFRHCASTSSFTTRSLRSQAWSEQLTSLLSSCKRGSRMLDAHQLIKQSTSRWKQTSTRTVTYSQCYTEGERPRARLARALSLPALSWTSTVCTMTKRQIMNTLKLSGHQCFVAIYASISKSISSLRTTQGFWIRPTCPLWP
jgi:hypothetical protein